MQCQTTPQAPLRTVVRVFRDNLPHRSRSERLLVVGCFGFGGISGWQQRRFNAAAARAVACEAERDVGDASTGLDAAGRSGQGGSGQYPILRHHEHNAGVRDNVRSATGPASGRRREGAGGVQGSAETAGLSADGSAPAKNNPLRIQRLRDREDKAQDWEAESSRRGTHKEGDTFDAIMQSANWRERDQRRGAAPKAQMRKDFSEAYYRSQLWGAELQQNNRTRRHAIHRERHKYSARHTDDGWLAKTLYELKQATPDEAEPYKKRMETVVLPPGIRAVFTGNVGESLLEILRRTGSHAHVVHPDAEAASGIETSSGKLATDGGPASSKESSPSSQLEMPMGIQCLKLWGTVKQNSDAMTLLPELMQAANEDDLAVRRKLEEYELRYLSKASGTSPSRTGSDDAMHALVEQWHEADENEGEVIPLTDTKVQAVHLHGPSPLRSIWVRGLQRRSADRDLLMSQQQTDAMNLKEVQNEQRQSKDAIPSVVKPNSSHTSAVSRLEGRDLVANGPAQIVPSDLSITSTIDFAAHIESITTQPSRLVRAKQQAVKYVPGISQIHTHDAQITEKLLALFNNTTYDAYVSTEAVELAFQYAVRQRDFSSLRAMFAALENNKAYTITASNFEVLLAAAASEEDLLNFRYVLRRMTKRGVKPTWQTWVRLHELVSKRSSDPDPAKAVEKVMWERGVMAHPQAMRRVVANGVEADLTAHLATSSEANLDTFVALYDQRYNRPDTGIAEEWLQAPASRTRDWLSTSTANRMVKVLLSQARTDDALHVLRLFNDSGDRPDVVTLNTFLSSASRARDASAAVAALLHFAPLTNSRHRPIKLNQRSYDLLFNMAWRRGWYNMTRVIWRYACCAGHVSWDMERRVKESLISYVPAPRPYAKREEERETEEVSRAAREARRGSDLKKALGEEEEGKRTMTRQELFFGWAGKFVVGVSEAMSFSRLGSDAMALTTGEREIIALSSQARSSLFPITETVGEPTSITSGSRKQQHHLRRKKLLAFLEVDLAETMSLRPPVPLAEMLEQAWQKDVRWKKRGLGQRSGELEACCGATEEVKASVYAKVFEEMISHGLKVPVVVGRMR